MRTEQPFDLASLPPIELIDAETDLRAFLGEGVPAEVTRAALRRGWSTDPAIRDSIGLSENSWDFNTPGAMPGFGCLEPEDIRRLAAQIIQHAEATGEISGQSSAPVQADATSTQSMEPGLNPERLQAASSTDSNSDLDTRECPKPLTQIMVAASTDAGTPIGRDPGDQQPLRQRRHGGAMPRIDQT
jgi:hypothetical protein